jgi:cytochrome c-type biogenesis protein CcsB
MQYPNSKFEFRLSLGVFFLIFSLPFIAQASSSSAFDILAKIPVQHAGRLKPFQSFAQEAVLYITGKNSFNGIEPAELVWLWTAEPERWSEQPLIPVSFKTLQQEFSLMLIGGRLSPEIVLQHDPFLKTVEAAMAKRDRKEKLSQEERKRLEIYERAYLFRMIGEGNIPGWIAHPEDPRKSWLPFRAFAAEERQQALVEFFPEEKVLSVKKTTHRLFEGLRSKSPSLEPLLEERAREFSQSLAELFQSRGIALDEKLLALEVMYNHSKPFTWAWKFYLASLLLGILFSLSGGEKLFRGFRMTWTLLGTVRLIAGLFFLAGFALHAYGFYLRCRIAGRPPVTNMYESIIWVSWAAVFFSVILSMAYRTDLIRLVASFVAVFALVVAQGFPTVLDPFVSPLVPVLRSNLWLTVHVLTITLSYGAFALAWGLGHAAIFSFAFLTGKEGLQQRLSQYLYRALQIGVVLLASGTVLGGVWANYSWGRFWGWDPKETWALIALLGYLTVLHGRFAGWLDSFGFAVGATISFLGVLMAWYGVNFVLAAGLHSYGFGGGGLPYVLAVVLLDLAMIAWATGVYKKVTSNQ